jgi:hypothetical protein
LYSQRFFSLCTTYTWPPQVCVIPWTAKWPWVSEIRWKFSPVLSRPMTSINRQGRSYPFGLCPQSEWITACQSSSLRLLSGRT